MSPTIKGDDIHIVTINTAGYQCSGFVVEINSKNQTNEGSFKKEFLVLTTATCLFNFEVLCNHDKNDSKFPIPCDA